MKVSQEELLQLAKEIGITPDQLKKYVKSLYSPQGRLWRENNEIANKVSEYFLNKIETKKINS